MKAKLSIFLFFALWLIIPFRHAYADPLPLDYSVYYTPDNYIPNDDIAIHLKVNTPCTFSNTPENNTNTGYLTKQPGFGTGILDTTGDDPCNGFETYSPLFRSTLLSEGITTIYYYLGHSNSGTQIIDYISGPIDVNSITDTYPEGSPHTTATLSPKPNNNGTLSGPVTVTLLATAEPGYTVTNIHYLIDCTSNCTPILYTGPFTISDSGTHTITYPATDNNGVSDAQQQTTFTIAATNAAPQINTLPNVTINEGIFFSQSGSFSDPDSTSWTASVDYGDGSGPQSLSLSGTNFSLSHLYKDSGTYTVTVNITDNQGATGIKTATVTVNNIAPTVGTITLTTSPVQVNNSLIASANFTDSGILDSHTASWNWGDGNTTTGTVTESNGSGSVSNSHTYTSTGVFTVTLTVTDDSNALGTSTYQYAVVYDPSAGWVNGNKDFTSPVGAVTGSSGATGKANFGFQVKYQGGSMVPSGKNVSLNFPIGNISFTSTGYEWLVLNGSKATFKADGALNGTSGYTLLVSTIDNGNGNATDYVRFQIKDSGGNVIYDTQPGAADTANPTTAVTKGKITVH